MVGSDDVSTYGQYPYPTFSGNSVDFYIKALNFAVLPPAPPNPPSLAGVIDPANVKNNQTKNEIEKIERRDGFMMDRGPQMG